MRLIAALGDANDITTWSGIPYHFLQAGQAAGMVDGGLCLNPMVPFRQMKRMLWNATKIVNKRSWGGYQYSEGFLEEMWRPHLPLLEGTQIINLFQSYPSIVVDNKAIKKWYFIDQTLMQLMIGSGARLKESGNLEIIARERAGYQAAEGIFVHSNWVAESCRRDYGISPDRIHVAVPGANIIESQYDQWESQKRFNSSTSTSLKILFLGRDWRRKGLDRLLLGYRKAALCGLRADLLVAGVEQKALPACLASVPGVTWLGLLNKNSDYGKFLQLVASCDLGVTLSYWEPGGIATREFHALGVPTMVTDVCGAAEHQIKEAGILLPALVNSDDVAEVLLSLPDRLPILKEAAWDLRHQAMYPATIEKMKLIFDQI